jgi:hypothetical protein
MKRLLLSIVTAVLAFAVVSVIMPAGQASASTGIGIQLTDGSAPNPSWMQASIPRGGSKTWHVKIVNTGTSTETAGPTASSALAFYVGGPAKQPASTLQPWITYDHSQLTLGPGQSAVVAVTVNVPAGAQLGPVPGYAPGSPSLSVNTFWAYAYPAGGQIQLASAAGVRMYITVTK